MLEQLRGTEVKHSLIGGFAFDRYGDMTPARLTILRIRGDLRRATRSQAPTAGPSSTA